MRERWRAGRPASLALPGFCPRTSTACSDITRALIAAQEPHKPASATGPLASSQPGATMRRLALLGALLAFTVMAAAIPTFEPRQDSTKGLPAAGAQPAHSSRRGHYPTHRPLARGRCV